MDVFLETDKPTYQVGETITVYLKVDGADPGGTKEAIIESSISVDGITYTASGPVTISWPPSDIRVESVVSEGMSFSQTDDPMVWTGLAV